MIVQKLALHQNGVEFRQQFNGAIGASLTALYDDARRLATLPKIVTTPTTTQPRHSSWFGHENDFAHPPPPTQKLNISL